jgi:hypothetical protein
MSERSPAETGTAPIQKKLRDPLCASVPLWFFESELNEGRTK